MAVPTGFEPVITHINYRIIKQ